VAGWPPGMAVCTCFSGGRSRFFRALYPLAFRIVAGRPPRVVIVHLLSGGRLLCFTIE